MPGSTIAIIPARAGSKGIKNKNMMRLAGRSILEWTVRAAVEALGEKNVVVSSDGDALLAHAAELGVLTHRRSAESSSDTASSESALIEALSDLAKQGIEPERLLFMQCTSPCVTGDDLRGLIQTFERDRLDSAFTATESHAFLWRRSADGTADGINHDLSFRPRRQDREPEYRENGAAYLVSTEGFLRHRHRFFGRCGLYEMPAERSFEIDSPEDAIVVEALLRRRPADARPELATKKAVIFDFDGVLTDNAVYVSEAGVESVRCDRGDGYGFEIARKSGLKTLILSKERNPVVETRAKKLRCEVTHGVDDKPTVLASWLVENGLDWRDIVYLGNDLNDLECIQRSGVGVAVADAVPAVIEAADLVLQKPGGYGAARELLEMILNAQIADNTES